MRKVTVALFAFILAIAFSLGCAKKEEPKAKEEKILLGWLKGDDWWQQLPKFKENFDVYQPDSAAVASIKGYPKEVSVLLFLGTWCSDSEREVPRFLKTLKLTQNPKIGLQVYGVPRGFAEKDEMAKKYGIEKVPTFIVSTDGKEVGRIIETPTLTVEEDFASLLME